MLRSVMLPHGVEPGGKPDTGVTLGWCPDTTSSGRTAIIRHMATGVLTVNDRPITSLLHLKSLPFALVHAAAVVLPFLVPFSWSLVGLAIALYLVRMFGITGGYHRYFSHRTYKTTRWFQFLLALIGRSLAAEGPALVVGAPPPSPSPQRPGRRPALASAPRVLLGPCGWILATDHEATEIERVPDLGEVPRVAMARRLPRGARHRDGGGALPAGRPAGVGVGLLREHRPVLALHVHDQQPDAHVRAAPLRDA